MTTTNLELEQLANVLEIPNFYCICKNEFNKIIIVQTLPLNIIMNLDNNDKSGSHWCLIFIDEKSKNILLFIWRWYTNRSKRVYDEYR